MVRPIPPTDALAKTSISTGNSGMAAVASNSTSTSTTTDSPNPGEGVPIFPVQTLTTVGHLPHIFRWEILPSHNATDSPRALARRTYVFVDFGEPYETAHGFMEALRRGLRRETARVSHRSVESETGRTFGVEVRGVFACEDDAIRAAQERAEYLQRLVESGHLRIGLPFVVPSPRWVRFVIH